MGLTTKEISSSSFNDMISSVDRRSEYVENRAGANVRLNNFLTPYTLDDKSSILNAPCGYSNGVYPSLRPVGGENLLLQSNQFDTTWGAQNVTLTSGQIGIGGSTDAWLYTVTNATHNITQNLSSANTNVFSVYAKANSADGIVLRLVGAPNNPYIFYSLLDGTYVGNGGGGGISPSSQPVVNMGDGWYRFQITATGLTQVVIYGGTSLGAFATTGSIYIQNAQVEKGYRATPYTETTTSPATNADFSFTRGSAATRVTKDGLVKNVQILSDELVQNGDFEEIGPEEVTNGDFSQIGGELVTNGDFDTDSNWTKGTGWSISGGKANCDGTQVSNSIFYQNIGNQGNKTVQFSFTISDYVSGVLETAFFGASGTIAETISANGNYTFYISVKSGHNGNTGFIAKVGFIGSIDNVSVKEVGQDWTFGTGWSMGDGKAVRVASSSTDLVQAGAFPNLTSIFKITFDVVRSAGAVRLRAGTLNLPYVNATDTYTYYVTPTSNDQIKFQADSSFEGSIDNVSVKEVGQNWTFYNSDSNTNTRFEDNAAVLDATANQFTRFISSSSPMTIGNLYRVTYEVIETDNIPINIQYPITSIDSSLGVHSVEIIATNANIGFSTTSAGVVKIDNVSVIEITDDTDLPRIDYTNGTGSLLLEPQRTNLYTYSNDVSFWTKNNVTTTSDYAFSPDGTQNAFRAQFTSSTGLLYITATGTTGTDNTLSVWAKSNNGSSSKFRFFANGNTTLSGDFIATDEWQRFEFPFNCTSVTVGLTGASDSATNDILFYGFQHEVGSYATSYIPTSGSTVTRNADVCNNAGSSDLINSTEGVLYFELKALTNGGSYRALGLSNSSNSNAVNLLYRLQSNTIWMQVKTNNVETNIFLYDVNQSQNNKIALSYKENDFALWVNGIKKGTNNNGLPPIGLETLKFSRGDGFEPFYGEVKCVAVFKEALTDEELAKITSTTQQEAFYEMRDKMLQINADYYEFGDYTTRLKKLF